MTSKLQTKIKECAQFLTAIWSREDRGLYSMIVAQEDPNDADSLWHTYCFRWPKGLKKAVERVFYAEHSGANVYFCPALYHTPERARENVAGAYTFWVDSDGNAPDTFDDVVPVPSIQVQTSHERNIHHYWLLDEFVTDIDALETANRSLASYIDADASGWDATQLLRPPGTTNRKHGLPVRVLTNETV